MFLLSSTSREEIPSSSTEYDQLTETMKTVCAGKTVYKSEVVFEDDVQMIEIRTNGSGRLNNHEENTIENERQNFCNEKRQACVTRSPNGCFMWGNLHTFHLEYVPTDAQFCAVCCNVAGTVMIPCSCMTKPQDGLHNKKVFSTACKYYFESFCSDMRMIINNC